MPCLPGSSALPNGTGRSIVLQWTWKQGAGPLCRTVLRTEVTIFWPPNLAEYWSDLHFDPAPCWELKWLYLTLHRAENWSGVIWGVTRGSFRRHLGGHLGSHLGGDLGGHMGRHLEVIWGSSGGICVCVCMYIYTRWPFPRPSNLTLSSRSLSSLSLSSLSLSSLSPWGDPYNFFLNAFCFCHGLLLIMSRQKQNALIDFAKCILLLSLTAADLLSPQKVKSSN